MFFSVLFWRCIERIACGLCCIAALRQAVRMLVRSKYVTSARSADQYAIAQAA
jgi:hypothetical protein